LPAKIASEHRKVLLVGGPDVDARLDLMDALATEFELGALGTSPALATSFVDRGYDYGHYRMSQGADPLGDLAAVRSLVRLFRDRRPSVVHTFDTKPGVWARLAAHRAGVPAVIGTLPGLGSLYAAGGTRARVLRAGYEPLQGLACRLSDATVFQNEDDAREFVRRRVVPAGKARVVPGSGIDTQAFAPGGAAATRAELGLPDDGLVVVTVTRLLRSKGVLELAAAARAAPELRFLLVGPAEQGGLDGLTDAELDEVRRSVVWAGPRGDVQRVLALADVFAYPSGYREGVPRALLEAAAVGLALVAGDGPGSRDVVEDGVTGLLVPPLDAPALVGAVRRLADSPQLRRRLGEAARERAVARFDLSVVARATRDLYREVLSGR
jgi:glycosyltransferase involved in cell wall biosynthesis